MIRDLELSQVVFGERPMALSAYVCMGHMSVCLGHRKAYGHGMWERESHPLGVTWGCHLALIDTNGIIHARSFHLAPAFADSDYTIMMLGGLTTLTSLRVSYRTWPLSLAQHDLSLLAPLTALRTLNLACCDEEGDGDPGLLALTTRALAELSGGLRELRSFHYQGPVVLDEDGGIADAASGCPTPGSVTSPVWARCPELATWRNLVDLSIEYSPGDCQPQPLLMLDLPGCLPTGLTSLTLARVALTPSALAGLSSHLPCLTSLSLSDFELGWGHLLALAGPARETHISIAAPQLQRQLNVLAISSSLRPRVVSTLRPHRDPRSAWWWSSSIDHSSRINAAQSHAAGECLALGASNERSAALRALGQFQRLDYVLLTLPPLKSPEQGLLSISPDELSLLTPALTRLRALSLHDTYGCSSWDGPEWHALGFA